MVGITLFPIGYKTFCIWYLVFDLMENAGTRGEHLTIQIVSHTCYPYLPSR